MGRLSTTECTYLPTLLADLTLYTRYPMAMARKSRALLRFEV